jgi:hypothetical protein
MRVPLRLAFSPEAGKFDQHTTSSMRLEDTSMVFWLHCNR